MGKARSIGDSIALSSMETKGPSLGHGNEGVSIFRRAWEQGP